MVEAWIKIAMPQVRKLGFIVFDQLADADTGFFRRIEFVPVPFRIEIEIAPLDHIEMGFGVQFFEGRDFGRLVGEAGKNEIVD